MFRKISLSIGKSHTHQHLTFRSCLEPEVDSRRRAPRESAPPRRILQNVFCPCAFRGSCPRINPQQPQLLNPNLPLCFASVLRLNFQTRSAQGSAPMHRNWSGFPNSQNLDPRLFSSTKFASLVSRGRVFWVDPVLTKSRTRPRDLCEHNGTPVLSMLPCFALKVLQFSPRGVCHFKSCSVFVIAC